MTVANGLSPERLRAQLDEIAPPVIVNAMGVEEVLAWTASHEP